ncbi:hypothetical protein [Sphingobium olei]|uniref:hypothetical protein n=1 Tax=Sphingobium olei TaxID=420955 RepID=UPI003D1EC459
MHVPPRGFHRIRHCGLLPSSANKDAMALARRLLVSLQGSRSLNPTSRSIIAPPVHVAAGT